MILRSCTMADLSLLEEWDPNGEMWVGDKHEWLANRVGDRSVYMFIGEFEVAQNPVAWGAIKVERGFTLSWFAAPLYRQIGNGTKIAQLMAQMVRPPIRAKINANRPYSERIAIRLGMRPAGGLLETGEKWWVAYQ